MIVRWGIAAALCAAALFLAPVGDVGRADAIWEHAAEVAGDDLGHPVWVDAVREAQRVRPWQAGFARQQARMRPVLAARRDALD